MAIMNIRDGRIYLDDFDKISDTAYFIFRGNGLEITPTKPNTILLAYKYHVDGNGHEKNINDLDLVKKLEELGYGKENIFISFSESYITEKPQK